MAKEVTMIVCPFCGMGRVLEQKGTRAERRGDPVRPKRIRFDQVDPRTAPFVDIREAPGGKVKLDAPRGTIGRGKAPGKGFRRIASLTLAEALKEPEFKDLIDQLKEQYDKVGDVLFPYPE